MIAVSEEGDAPEGWVIVAPTQDDFYKALVDSYATAIVERIEE